jgi:hypothetical protein
LTERIRPDGWRERALGLGVNPDEPDDFRYWSAFDRATAIVDSFRYHQPNHDQVQRISAVRVGCTDLACVILRNTKAGADQTAALRKLHEAMMTANKSIVCEVEV